MSHSLPHRGQVVNFAQFVAGRRRLDAALTNDPDDDSTAPYLPGFDERARPLTHRSVEHRRRMLVHLAATKGS
jgi:hypothetical protein